MVHTDLPKGVDSQSNQEWRSEIGASAPFVIDSRGRAIKLDVREC
jgi:hypothetical protein